MNLLYVAEHMERQSTRFPVDVPIGKCGEWEVREVVADPGPIANMRIIRDGVPEAVVTPGTVVKTLVHPKHGVVMSNTQFEYRTSAGFVQRAAGHVLITGLGLGMILRPLHATGKVTEVTVIELEQDVIDLVLPTYQDLIDASWLHVIRADAKTCKFVVGTKFDMAWHDIWSSYGAEYVVQHQQMRRHYRQWVKGSGNQFCWAEEICMRLRKEER